MDPETMEVQPDLDEAFENVLTLGSGTPYPDDDIIHQQKYEGVAPAGS